jgi:hypothetical protein
MILNDFWDMLENELFPMPSERGLFNQYGGTDQRVDLPNAHEIRRQNLMNYLKSLSERPSALVVGEAAGPWGCRFSGVPFAGERQLHMHALPFSGHRSSRDDPLMGVWRKPPYTSRSAEIFWGVMKPHYPKFVVWDCVPFHPHNPDNILSVRRPTRAEIASFSRFLREIYEVTEPICVIAVGRKAEYALNTIGVCSHYVRHPSRGGAKRFGAEVARIFKSQKQ